MRIHVGIRGSEGLVLGILAAPQTLMFRDDCGNKPGHSYLTRRCSRSTSGLFLHTCPIHKGSVRHFLIALGTPPVCGLEVQAGSVFSHLQHASTETAWVRVATQDCFSRSGLNLEWMRVAQREFKVSARRHLLALARKGYLPGHPIGPGIRKTWKFRISELNEWMQHEVNSSQRLRSCSRRVS
jgi:hypothetical protein